MTTLEITPRRADKTARFKGAVAAGESVSVIVKGGAEWTAGGGLRLRVVGLRGETLAQFPPETEIEDESATPEVWGADEGNTDATCTLDLRTDKMMRAVPPGATIPFLFVLDDATDGGETLYFKDLHEITHWPQRTGEDNPPPHALRGYRDFVKDVMDRVEAVETRIGNLTLRARRFTEAEGGVERNGVEITIWDGVEDTEPAVVKLYDGEVSLAQMNAAIASAVAAKADGTAFENHANDTTRHITATERSTWNAKYAKPSGGIPKSDLAAAVQTLLGKADTALQVHQDVSGKVDRTELIAALEQKASQASLDAEVSVRANADAAFRAVLDVLTGSDANKSVREIAAMEVAKVVAGADASFDTLKEIADWITNDTTGAAKMANDVSSLRVALGEKLSVAEAESGYTRWTVECEVPGVTIEWAKIADDPVAYAWVPYRNGNPFGMSGSADKDATSVTWTEGTASAVIVATRHRITPTKTSQLTNDSGFLTQHQDVSGKEDSSNKVAALSAQSTDAQYPSAKCVYDELALKAGVMDLRYALASPQAVDGVVTLQDRAVNVVSLVDQSQYTPWSSFGRRPGLDQPGPPVDSLRPVWDSVSGKWTVVDTQGVYSLCTVDAVSPSASSAAATSVEVSWAMEVSNVSWSIENSPSEGDPSATVVVTGSFPDGSQLKLDVSCVDGEQIASGVWWFPTLDISNMSSGSYGDSGYRYLLAADTEDAFSLPDCGLALWKPDADAEWSISFRLDPVEPQNVSLLTGTSGFTLRGVGYASRERVHVAVWSDGGNHGDVRFIGGDTPWDVVDSDLNTPLAYAQSDTKWTVEYLDTREIQVTVKSVDGGVVTAVTYNGVDYEVQDGTSVEIGYTYYALVGADNAAVGDVLSAEADVTKSLTLEWTFPTSAQVPLLAAPSAVAGKVRDFLIRLDVPADTELPLKLGVLETENGEFPELKAGVNLLLFTETSQGHFLVMSKSVKAVA